MISNSLLLRNAVNHPSVAFRRTAILGVGSYQHMPLFEDYYLWLRARRHSLHFLNLPIPLVYMRRTNTLQRRSGRQYFNHELNFLKVILKQKLMPPFYAIFFLARLLIRMLPLPFQILQNYLPWRSRLTFVRNPEISIQSCADTLAKNS